MTTVYSCPSCHKHVSVDHPSPEGHRFRCTHCNTIFRAQAKSPAPAAVAAGASAAPSGGSHVSVPAPAAKSAPPAPTPPKPTGGSHPNVPLPPKVTAPSGSHPNVPPPARPLPPLPPAPPPRVEAEKKPAAENRPAPPAAPRPEVEKKPAAEARPPAEPPRVKPAQPTLQGVKPKPEADDVRPDKGTYPGTVPRPEPEAPPSPGQAGRDTHPGNQKLEAAPTEPAASKRSKSSRDTFPGNQKAQDLESKPVPDQPRPGKETYAGNLTLEEIQKRAESTAPKVRPTRPTYPGTSKPGDEAAADAGRKLKSRETFAGNQTAEEIHAASQAEAPVKARPSWPGQRKPPTGDVPAGTPLACPACDSIIKLAITTPVGRTFKCPGCSQPVPVDWPSEEVLARAEQAPAAPPVERHEAPASSAPVLDRPSLTEAVAEPKAAAAEAPAARKIPWLAVGGGAGLLVFSLLLGYFFLSGGAIPDSAWAVFTPPGGVCEVQLPGRPILQTSQGVANPRRGTTQYYVRRDEQNALFILTYVNLPGVITPAAFDDIYQSERSQVLEAFKGAVQREQDAASGGHFGKELVVAAADGRLVALRMFLVEGDQFSRVYILEASGRWKSADQGPPARFLNSLKLPGRGKAAPPTEAS